MTGSKSTQKSKTKQFGFTELEELLQGINLDTLRTQLGQITQQIEFQAKQFAASAPALEQLRLNQEIENSLFTPEEQKQRRLDEITRQDQISAGQDELLERQLELIRGGPGATDEQKFLINQSTEAQIASGESDILDFSRRALSQIAEELAPSRGLRPTDSPIQDRGFLVGEEAVRQQGQLVRGLRGAQSQAELNFPLAANQSQAALGQFQQQLGQTSEQFNQQLQQQAFQNRLNLSGQSGNLGLGLIGGTQPATQLQETFRPQLSTASSGTSKSGGISARRKKFGFKAVNHADTLEALVALPVETWTYKPEFDHEGQQAKHIGAYAEDFAEAFGVGDGETINYLDAIGVCMSTIKALAKEVEELRNG